MARILKSLDASGRGRKLIFIQKGSRPTQVMLRPDPETPKPKQDEQKTEVSVIQEGELEKGEIIAVRKVSKYFRLIHCSLLYFS